MIHKWHKYMAVVLLAGLLSSCAGRVTSDNLLLDDRVAIVVQSDMDDDAKVEAIRAVLERERDAGANWIEILTNASVQALIVGLLK